MITIDDNHFVPITNKTVKPIRFDGTTFIPVYKVTDKVASDLIKTPKNVTGKVDTFKVGDIHYIPKYVIHEDYRQIFRPKLVLTPEKSKPVIQINGEHFVPINNKTYKPIVIQEKTWIPVKKANETQI